MGLLIDMNLSPEWVDVWAREGWQSVHWSGTGNPRAADHETMNWAPDNGYVVLTHDLDCGTMLALTRASGPSVVQVRAQDALPDGMKAVLFATLRQHQSDLESGALVVVDPIRSRVRLLPI